MSYGITLSGGVVAKGGFSLAGDLIKSGSSYKPVQGAGGVVRVAPNGPRQKPFLYTPLDNPLYSPFTITWIGTGDYILNEGVITNTTGYKIYRDNGDLIGEVFSPDTTSFEINEGSSGEFSYYIKSTLAGGNHLSLPSNTITIIVNMPPAPATQYTFFQPDGVSTYRTSNGVDMFYHY
jgi:hypothetical protein